MEWTWLIFNYGLLYWGPGKDNKKQRMSNISGDPNYGTLEFRRSFLPTILFCQYQPSGISNSNVHKFHRGNHDRCTAIFRELHGYTGIFRSWWSITHQNEDYRWVSRTNFNKPRGWPSVHTFVPCCVDHQHFPGVRFYEELVGMAPMK